MAGLACAKCFKFLRCIKTGVSIEEGMPLDDAGNWGSYKLWSADLYECPECRAQMVTGFGRHPVREHFESDYAKVLEGWPPIGRIDDCGGAKP